MLQITTLVCIMCVQELSTVSTAFVRRFRNLTYLDRYISLDLIISCIRFQLSKFFDPVTTRPPSYQLYRLYLCGVFETLLIHL